MQRGDPVIHVPSHGLAEDDAGEKEGVSWKKE